MWNKFEGAKIGCKTGGCIPLPVGAGSRFKPCKAFPQMFGMVGSFPTVILKKLAVMVNAALCRIIHKANTNS